MIFQVLTQHQLQEWEGFMIRYKWSTVPYLLSVLLLLVPAAVVHAVPVATSNTAVNCIGTTDGSNILVSGVTSSTCSELAPSGSGTWGSDADASTSGLLSVPSVPGGSVEVGKAEVSGVNTGSTGGSMSASAQLLIYFDLVDLVDIGLPSPPPGTVTINIEYSGGGSGHQYLSQARTNWGVNESFTNEQITNTVISGPSFSDTHTINFIDDAVTSPLDWDALIWLTASCDAGGGVGATCDAFVDPIVSFADPNHANFYAFNFSSNLPTIPVPPAVWLFGSGLIGLIGIARRKKA